MNDTSRPDTIGIVAARAGSKSIKDKNLTLLGGYPLIAYAIVLGKMAGIDRVLFSSDSQRYCDIATTFGAEVPFLRPADQAGDGAPDIAYFEHLMEWLQDSEGSVPEYWVHLRPTTPLRQPGIIEDAVADIKSSQVATALRSAHLCAESPMKWFRKDGDFFKSLAQGGDEQEFFNLPKQDFPDAYIPDGYVDVIRASHLMREKTLHGPHTLAFNSPVCTEVDSQAELDYLEYQVGKFGSPILDHMRQHFPDYQPDQVT